MVDTKVGKYSVEPPSISKSILYHCCYYRLSAIAKSRTDPSRTALPKGRVLLDPPRNKSQTVFANCSAWLSLAKPAEPVAPPRLMVTILPAFWHVSISEARKLQSGSWVPSKTASLLVLQVYHEKHESDTSTWKWGTRVH